jgi:hypothetical protein
MQLFPRTKDEWIKMILFPFKTHLAVVCLIILLFTIHHSWSVAVLDIGVCFSVYGGMIDFLAFIAMAIFWLARRRYKESQDCFLFALTAIVVLLLAPAFAAARH